MEPKKTTLYETHKELGAKILEFAGFLMPIKYSSEIAEHKAVRENVGMFDVSHMGEIDIKGPEAKKFCQYITCNDVEKLVDGKIQYTVFMRENGGVVDDTTLYRFSEEHFMFCVNASNIEKDYKYLCEQNKLNCEIINKSDYFDQFAVQGPKAKDLIKKSLEIDLESMKPFRFIKTEILGSKCILSRTGYTGEDGCEIYMPKQVAKSLWSKLIEDGKEFSLLPIGLGARDTLRLEAAYILYGNDLDDNTTPIEAGIGWTVKMDKGDFLGKDVLAKNKEGILNKKLIGFKMDERAIPRHGYKIFFEDKEIGEVSSGGFSPLLNIGIGMGFIKPEIDVKEKEVGIEIRGTLKKAKVVPLPFYKRQK